MSDQNEKKPGRDYVILGPKDENGNPVCIRHKPDHTIQVGTIIPTRDGVPIHPGSEIVKLTSDGGPCMDVEVLYDGSSESTGTTKGPAKVTTQAYRESWDRIFGSKPVIGSA